MPFPPGSARRYKLAGALSEEVLWYALTIGMVSASVVPVT